MIGTCAAKFETVLAMLPIQVIAQGDSVIDILCVGVFSQAGIWTADKDDTGKAGPDALGRPSCFPIWLRPAALLGCSCSSGCSKRQFVDYVGVNVQSQPARELAKIIDGPAA